MILMTTLCILMSLWKKRSTVKPTALIQVIATYFKYVTVTGMGYAAVTVMDGSESLTMGPSSWKVVMNWNHL